MAGSYPAYSVDLLGSQPASYFPDHSFVPTAEPGRTVDLSGAGPSLRPPPSASSSSSTSAGSGFGSSYAAPSAASRDRGPTSIEGGGPGLSLSSLAPANLLRQLATRPVTDLVAENGRLLLEVPRYMVRAYSAAARRYLRPWSEFARIRPARVLEGFREASRRGEVQVYLQRNVLANARAFCPNYAFIFLAMLFMFVCTSPMLLLMLGGVGGAWSHALRDEGFRARPWTLQIGGVHVPLGANLKMAIMTLPTLLFLHFFLGPVLWSAALCSGGVSVVHAALRDRDERDDDRDRDDENGSAGRLRELP